MLETTSLEQILEIANNKGKYDKFVKDIKKRLDEVKAQVALIGKASEIKKLHEQALEDAAHARTVLERAKKESKGIEDGALAELKKEQKELDQRKAMIDKDEKKFRDYEKAKTKDLSILKSCLDKHEKDLKTRELKVQSLNGETLKIESEFNRKTRILEEALKKIV